MPHEIHDNPFFASDEPALIDAATAYSYLTRSYWSTGIPRETVERAIRHSLCIGVYDSRSPRSADDERPAMVGFGRVITDRATFAYLSDVFVLEEYRGEGLSKLWMRTVKSHPDLQNLRRWMLLTKDAHGLYRQFGFTDCTTPDRVMEILDPDIYSRKGQR